MHLSLKNFMNKTNGKGVILTFLLYFSSIVLYLFIDAPGYGIKFFSIVNPDVESLEFEGFRAYYKSVLLSVWLLVLLKVVIILMMGVAFILLIYKSRYQLSSVSLKRFFRYFLVVGVHEKIGFFVFVFLSVLEIYNAIVFSEHVVLVAT